MAKKTAAGPSTEARTTGDFRRFLGNECRPTPSTITANGYKHSNGPTCDDVSAGHEPEIVSLPVRYWP
jgi:hypothetical protein